MHKNSDSTGERFEREPLLTTFDSNQKSILADIHLSTISTVSVIQALKKIVEAAKALSPADDASIILWDANRESFFMSATTVKNQADWVPAKRVRQSTGATYWITQIQQVHVVSNIKNDRFQANAMLIEYGYQAYIGVPILIGNKSLGVIYCLYKSCRTFKQEEIDFIHQLALYAANSIQSAIVTEESQKQINILTNLVAEKAKSLKVFEEKLIDASEVKSKFVTNITHEFRTPIANAYLYLDLLSMTGPDKKEKYLERIKSAVGQLEKLIEKAIDKSTGDAESEDKWN